MVRLLVAAVAVPLVSVPAILAFAWPAARTAPRDIPVGIVVASRAAQYTVEHLRSAQPGAFKFRLYADLASAVHAIHQREIDGAFDATTSGITVYAASAGSPAIAQVLTTFGAAAAAHGDCPHEPSTWCRCKTTIRWAASSPFSCRCAA